MDRLKKTLKWVVYIILAIIAIGVVAAGGLVFLAIGASIGAIVLGAFVVLFLAAGIKEYWEASRNK